MFEQKAFPDFQRKGMKKLKDTFMADNIVNPWDTFLDQRILGNQR
jgi:hypothetical protein